MVDDKITRLRLLLGRKQFLRYLCAFLNYIYDFLQLNNLTEYTVSVIIISLYKILTYPYYLSVPNFDK